MMTRRFFREPFTLTIDVEPLFSGMFAGMDALPDFSGSLFIRGDECGKRVRFSRSGGACVSCSVSGKVVAVPVPAAALLPGVMYYELVFRVPDSSFPSGFREILSRGHAGVELTRVSGTVPVSEVAVLDPCSKVLLRKVEDIERRAEIMEALNESMAARMDSMEGRLDSPVPESGYIEIKTSANNVFMIPLRGRLPRLKSDDVLDDGYGYGYGYGYGDVCFSVGNWDI